MAQLGDNLYEYDNPRAVLVSGRQTITQSSCAVFTVYYTSAQSFNVRAPACIQSDTGGVLLQVTASSLGATWHNVWLPLTLATGVTACDAQLQFEVFYDGEGIALDVSVAIGSVSVDNTSCLPSNETTFGCDFSDINQCGYRDMSASSYRWMRRIISFSGMTKGIRGYEIILCVFELS